jgi:hypothetical protein
MTACPSPTVRRCRRVQPAVVERGARSRGFRAYIPKVTIPLFPKRPPVTVIAFFAVVVTVLVYLLLFGRVDGWLFGGGLLLLLASFGLMRGIWFAWLLLTVVAAGDLVMAAIRWPAWEAALVNGTLLALLVFPSTLRHVWRPHFLSRAVP